MTEISPNQHAGIIITESDYERLSRLIDNNPSPAAAALAEEIERAEIVTDDALPADVVPMNATVSFEDLDTGATRTVRLVYPRDADVSQMRISVLSLVGSALIGLAIGGTIEWPLAGGKRAHLRVTAIETAAE
jgi:regulator of nucleoside diphosphate kinase